MKPETRSLLEKADRSVVAARQLLDAGHADFAASRAYYGAFYAAEAYLLEQGLSFSSHSAVIAAFGRHGVKEGGLAPALHSALRDAFERRNVADYGGHREVTQAEAARVIEESAGFVTEIRGHLERS